MPDDTNTKSRTTLHVRVREGGRLGEPVGTRLRTAKRGDDIEAVDLVLILESLADLSRLMSEANLQLLRTVAQEEPGSIRQAAALVDRDYKGVHRNLSDLEAMGVIAFLEEGRSKRPVAPFDEIDVKLSMIEEGDRSTSTNGTRTIGSTQAQLSRKHTKQPNMPITIDEFESGDVGDERSVPLRVAEFLHENRHHAFTRSKIAEAINAEPNVVGSALSRFKQANLVRHRGRYWAITEDTERLRSAYNLHEVTETLNEEG